MSTEMIWQTNSIDSADTERLGELLGSLINVAEVIELRADLGGGKTTFTRGLARGLGSKDTVSSPTFTLSKAYICRDGLGIHHFDFYRLSDPGILADQLAESLQDKNIITVIEWSNIVKDVLPDSRIIVELKLDKKNPDSRLISFTYTQSAINLIKKLESAWTEIRP